MRHRIWLGAHHAPLAFQGRFEHTVYAVYDDMQPRFLSHSVLRRLLLVPIPRLRGENPNDWRVYRFTERHQLSIVSPFAIEIQSFIEVHRGWTPRVAIDGARPRACAGDVGAFRDIDERERVVREPVLGYSGTGTLT